MQPLAISDSGRPRSLEDADANELYALIEANRAHLARWLPWAQGEALEGTRAFIELTRQQRTDGRGIQMAIEYDGAIVGVAGLTTIHRPQRSARSASGWPPTRKVGER